MRLDPGCHCPAHIVILRVGSETGTAVFLAQIPGHCQVVAETGNELALIEFTHDAGVAVIEKQFVFCLLGHHMQHDAQFVHVIKDDFPLIKF